MARYSKTSQGMKLAEGDSIRVHGVRGSVLDVMLIRANDAAPVVDVLVQVDFSNGKGSVPNMLHYSDIQEVRHDGQWVNLKGEAVEV